MEREIEGQQPPHLHQQAPDPDPTSRGKASDKPAMPAEKPSPLTVRQLPLWRSKISQLATRYPLTRRKLVVAAVIVGVLALFFGLRSPSPPSVPTQTAPDTRQFSITNRPTLVFEHFIGNVNIMPGPSGQVSIKEKKNGETDSIAIHYTQHGDTITVTVDIPGGLMVDTWVDFDVTVPGHAGLTTTMATGTLEATDLSGRIALSNTNGAIWATNLAGSIGLKTQSGAITLTNVSGQVAVATQNGTITTTATHLQGRSSIQAESGTINFHGTLSRTGSYLFQNSNGAVGLTLPPGSAFVLAAHTASGSINSDFRGVTIYHENGHSEARGAAGAAAHAQLTIQTAGGSIDLHQGG
jgi:hypothetical protein